jgi:hypothetical protein
MRAAFNLLICGLLVLGGCESAADLQPQNSFIDQTELAKSSDGRSAPPSGFVSAPAPVAKGPTDVAEPVAAAANLDRTIIYTASMNLSVTDLNQTLDAIRSAADALGGYLEEMDSHSITVRVPARHLDELISTVGKMGEVVQKQMRAQDVTEEMRDLNIRLDNAQQIRDRLLKLLDKADKMEDTLKIEAELERVTETVELLKGKIKYLQTQAALSTLTVQLNSPVPQNQQIARIPFPWVLELGSGLVSGNVSAEPAHGGWFDRGISFDLPHTYVKYYQQDGLTEALSAEGMLVKVQMHDNVDRAGIEFWSELARKELVESRALTVTQERDITLRSGVAAHLVIGTKELAGQHDRYLVAIASNSQHVVTFEAWGPQREFDADETAMQSAIQSLDFGR